MENRDFASLNEQIEQYSKRLMETAATANTNKAKLLRPQTPVISPPPPPPREEAANIIQDDPNPADRNPMPEPPPIAVQPLPQPSPNVTPAQEYELFTARNPFNGILRVQTLTARRTYPVPGATVVISKFFDSGEHIIATESTDNAGFTRPVRLPAPDPSLSQQPGTGVAPFADYRATITHPDFATVILSSIPVFAGVTALQNVNLIPKSASPSGNTPIEYSSSEPKDL